MKKKLILGLFVCMLSLTLSLSLNISIKANASTASTSELSISPILVPIEKVDLVKNLISDIEFDLSEKDTNVISELSTFKTKCQELLFTNDNENVRVHNLVYTNILMLQFAVKRLTKNKINIIIHMPRI